METPELFKAYPVLMTSIPWTPLGTTPTPVERMESLGQKLGCPSLWVKRDDLSSDKMGGNKVRIMEFLLARMKADRKTVAISPGPLGSNQIMASAIYGSRLGVKVVGVFLKQCETDYMCKHMLIDQSMGVEFNHVRNPAFAPFSILYHYLRNVDWRRLRAPFYIPSFGSSATCALGYLNATFELARQLENNEAPEPDYIFVTAGTGGTMAGIELGVRLLGLKSKVVGVRITDWIACNERIVASVVNRTARLLQRSGADIPSVRVRASEITMLHRYFGGEYARITEEGLEAQKMCKDLEGLSLDTTYTAKTMAAMMDYIKKQGIQDKNVLFWHTYNSRDLSPFLDEKAKPRQLPPSFRKYFEKQMDS
ncbi:MAG: pyridoxal-phosphate dependent enzyme [bacterium]